MNREAASRQINGFESNNEARATRQKFAFDRWTAFPGVGFFRPGLRLNDWTRSRRNQAISSFGDREPKAKRRNMARDYETLRSTMVRLAGSEFVRLTSELLRLPRAHVERNRLFNVG